MSPAQPADPVTDEASIVPAVSLPLPRSAEELDAELEVLEQEGHHYPADTLAAAVELDSAATALGEAELAIRAKLVQSDMWDRLGEVATGARMALEVNRWAADNNHRPLLARSHRLLATTYHNLGDTAAGLEHALLGVEFLDEDSPPRVRAVHLSILADHLGWTGLFQAARERYNSAGEIAEALGDVLLQLSNLNNLAYTECDAGDFDRAGAVVEQMRELSAGLGSEVVAGFLDTFARVEIGLGRYAEAEQTTLKSLDIYYSSGRDQDADTLAEDLLTLAEAQRRQGKLTEAQANLDLCDQVCQERNLADVRLRMLQEQAEVHAAGGRFKEAFDAHKVFRSEEKALLSRERESQAQTRHAMFETAEARQEAQRFREQALHDPLTGLYNRRYVDEQLPVVLAHAAQGGDPLVVALIDLDHFKCINDTYSHDVGDQVLIVVARLLAAAARIPDNDTESGFAARMGGEEFLLVLPMTRTGDAVRRLEQLRLAVRSHDWRGLTADLTVTVSIGAATADARLSQPELLARADHNLYAAKNAGRDRVIVDRDTADRVTADLITADPDPETNAGRRQFRESHG